MAVIEYRITVDENGNASVQEEITEIGNPDGDFLIFSTEGKNLSSEQNRMAIRHVDASPFLTNGPLSNKVFVLQPGRNGPFKVEQSNQQAGIPWQSTPFGPRERVFHFECGEVDPNGVFRLWGGGGANDPPTGGGNFGG